MIPEFKYNLIQEKSFCCFCLLLFISFYAIFSGYKRLTSSKYKERLVLLKLIIYLSADCITSTNTFWKQESIYRLNSRIWHSDWDPSVASVLMLHLSKCVLSQCMGKFSILRQLLFLPTVRVLLFGKLVFPHIKNDLVSYFSFVVKQINATSRVD